MKKRGLNSLIKVIIKESTEDDVCGLCGQPGADKVPHPIYWPGEQQPQSQYVHAECESEETERAFQDLSQTDRDRFLDRLVRFNQ